MPAEAADDVISGMALDHASVDQSPTQWALKVVVVVVQKLPEART